MNEKQLCAEVVWRIENFTYCWQDVNEYLSSGTFFLESIGKTAWKLSLYPKGKSGNEDCVGICLFRAENDLGIVEVCIDSELSILENESSHFKTVKGKNEIYLCSEGWVLSDFLSHSDIQKNADKLLPGNVLTISYKMWFACEQTRPIQVRLRTLVPITKYAFVWNIKTGTSKHSNDNAKTIVYESIFGTETCLKVVLCYTTEENSKEDFIKISVMGDVKEKLSFKSDFQHCLSKNNFLSKKGKVDALPFQRSYSVERTLACELNCEFTLISQKVMNDIFCYESDTSPLWNQKFHEKKMGKYLAETDCKTSLKTDVLKMYQQALKSDFEFQVDSQIFPVHSCVLSARSPVLERMLEADMKEKQEKVLKIDDIDVATVKRMLDYLYTDDPGELSVELVLKLYYAADKYQIMGLKQISLSYLMDNITTINLYEIFMLSYRHNVEDLKMSVIRFVYENEKDVVLSDSFKTFSKNNPHIGMEIVQELFTYKFNME